MKSWKGFKEFGGAIVIKPFSDDSGNTVEVGKKITIADIPGPDGFIVDIPWPDDTLVGGVRFTTATCSSEFIRPL